MDGQANKGQYLHGKLIGKLKEFLLNQDTLQRWAGFSLSHRCNVLAIEKQVVVHPATLMRFYKRNGVKYYSLTYVEKKDHEKIKLNELKKEAQSVLKTLEMFPDANKQMQNEISKLD